MAGLFSRKRRLADILYGFSDIHAHLLPGVDDGSPSVEKSQELLRRLENAGVQRMYLTPHIINGLYDSLDEAQLRDRFSGFSYAGGIDLRLAAEYMLDDGFLTHVNGEPLAMDDSLLVEFALNTYPINATGMLFDASMAGYGMIIAHPERYTFVKGSSDEFLKILQDAGYRLQLNLLSLTGFHGSMARKHAEEFLEAGLYTFVATDIHSLSYIDNLEEHKVTAKQFAHLEQLRENNLALFGM